MEQPLIISAIVVFVVALVGIPFIRERKRVAVWRDVAERLGLEFSGTQIFGTLDGVDVEVFKQTRRVGKHESVSTLFRANLDPDGVPQGLELSREHLLRKLDKALGSEDLQLDLPGIDEQLMVRGYDPLKVREWAQRTDVSRALADLCALRTYDFHLADAQLTFVRSGNMLDGKALETRISKLAKAARALSAKGDVAPET